MANIVQEANLTKQPPPLHRISVDSLKLRIPLSQVEILDPIITEKWFWVSESGVVDPDRYKENALEVYADKHELIKVRFGIEKQRTDRQTTENFLTILLPSKILMERYFEGFTLENIDKVYDTLMSIGVVKFSKYVFLHESACTDTDFKKDFQFDNLDLLIGKLSASVIPSKQKGDGIKPWRQSDNKGIEFNERKTSRYQTRPFLKIYHKGIELTTLKRRAFTDTYLKGIDIENVCRIEATVKNKKHFRILGIEDTSLYSVLSISQEQAEKIISKAVACNLEPRIIPFRTPSELTPNKQVMYSLMHELIRLGHNYDTVKRIALNGIIDKSARSKKAKEIEEIYNKHIRGNQVDTEAEELNRIYDVIGWK